MDEADHYIDRVSDLPPAPTIAVELLGLFNDPDHDIDKVVDLISHDPGLTVAILKRCNSAALGGSEAASDMFEAVTRLGFYEVHCVVASLVGARAMAVGKSKGVVDATSLWRHSVVTAVAAATLAKRLQTAEATAFTSGLLHDVGKLVFASVESATYAELINQKGSFGSGLAEAEQTAFGVTRASIGARLLTRWGLPANVAGAAGLHHGARARGEPFGQLATTVGLASDLARQMLSQKLPGSDLLSSRPDAMILFQLTEDNVPTLISQVQKDLQRVQALLQMSI
jgi:HD-like signal output (HDOD) protein